MDSNATSQSESTPATFHVGQYVKWKDHEGVINSFPIDTSAFVFQLDQMMIQISKHNQREVCICCFSEDWKNVEVYNNK